MSVSLLHYNASPLYSDRMSCQARFWRLLLVILAGFLGLGITLWQSRPVLAADLLCFTSLNGSTTFASSADAQALVAAIAAAAPSDTVRVAGNCSGSGLPLVLTSPITISGGYTTSSWSTATPNAQPTILDGLGSSQVLNISGQIDVTLNDTILRNGNAGQGDGGCLYINQSYVTLNNTQIYGCQAQNGGGVRVGSTLVLNTGTVISGNSAVGNGGGVLVSGTPTATLIVQGGQILTNTATNGGGVAVIGSGNVMTMSSGLIADNIAQGADGVFDDGADGFGGAVYNSGEVWISGGVLQNNLAQGGMGGDLGSDGGANGGSGHGGAIYSDLLASVTIYDAILQDNTAVGGDGFGGISTGNGGDGGDGVGGAMENHGSLSITNTQLSGNLALGGSGGSGKSDGGFGGDAYGGAIALLETTPTTLTGLELFTNTVQGGDGAYGGSVGGNGGSGSGGAIYSEQPQTLQTSRVEDNLAFAGLAGNADGGDNGLPGISNGGAIFTSESLVITATQFLSNSAESGGAIYQENREGHIDQQIVNSIFAHNNVDNSESGSDLFRSANGTLELRHVTIGEIGSSSQSGAPAIWIDKATSAAISNTIIVSHEIGIQNNDDTLTILGAGNLFFGTSANTQGIGSFASGFALSDADPAFVDVTNDDYHLSASSPAIDQGVAVAVADDFDGNSRPQGGGFDVGAFESSYLTDLAIAKSATTTQTQVGNVLTYTLTLSNSGTATAYDATVTDTLPAGVTPLSPITTSEGSLVVDSSAITLQLSSLAVGANVWVTIPVQIDTAGTITNTAWVTASSDYTASNNLAQVVVTAIQPLCWATADDGSHVYASEDAQAVRDAIAVANSGDTVRIAGYCAGAISQAGTSQVALITKTLTLAGGYTTTNWSLQDPATHLTILDALSAGRVINASQPLSVTDLILQNGMAVNAQGGAMYAGSTLWLSGGEVRQSNVSGSSPNGHGGGAFVVGNATISGTNFFSNTASTHGGGAYVGSSATISGTGFLSNMAGGAGGGAYVVDRATISDTSFLSNTAISSGGGAYVYGSVTIRNTSFHSNTSLYGGGAYVIGNAVIWDTSFVSNTGVSVAGGLYVNSSATISSTSFLSNTAGNSGGGVYVNSSVAISGTSFYGNLAGVSGGGAYIVDNGVISGTSFLSNTAGGAGGGAYLNRSATISDTSFLSNTALSEGGAIYLKGSDSGLTNSILRYNTATLYGGGVRIDGGNLNVTNSEISENQAQYGAGVYVGSTFTLGSGAVISANHAISDGGGIYVSPGITSALHLNGGTIVSNTADGNGGGVFITGTTSIFTFTQGTLTENYAANNGGGVYLDSGTLQWATGISLTANQAGNQGGGLYALPAVTLSDITVQDNRANVGAGVWVSDSLTLSNTQFLSNTASGVGGGAYTLDKAEVTSSLFTGNQSSDTGAGLYAKASVVISDSHFLTNLGTGLSSDDGATVQDSDFLANSGRGLYAYQSVTVTQSTFNQNGSDGLFSNQGGAWVTASELMTNTGRGLYAYRSVTITASTINRNGSDGAFVNQGGAQVSSSDFMTNGQRGIYASLSVVISDSNFVNNRGGSGAGIFVNVGGVTVTASSFISNGVGTGAGIFSRQLAIIHDSRFIGNRSGGSSPGAALYSDQGAQISDSYFEDNFGGTGGAVFTQQSANITNTQFISNSSTWGGDNPGGALFVNNGALVVLDSSFTQNHASNDGGALFARQVMITNTDFLSNTSLHNGGAVFSNGPAQIADSLFQNNLAYASNGFNINGGALFVNGALSTRNSDYISNTTLHLGGAIFAQSATVQGGQFILNRSLSQHAGAVWINGGNPVIDSAQFISNTAVQGGGALWSNPPVVVSNTHFVSNTAQFGGALFANSTLQMTGSEFRLNVATGGNGGGAVSNGAAQITNTLFASNTTSSQGGGLYVQNTTSLANVQFTNNSAIDGGGAYVQGRGTVLNSAFMGNNVLGSEGGALYLVNGAQIISNTSFTGNSATGGNGTTGEDGRGGAIFISTTATLALVDSNFSSNLARGGDGSSQGGNGLGGALFSGGSTVITRTSFVSNSVLAGAGGSPTSQGGAIYIGQTEVSVISSTLTSNLAEDGGAIYNSNLLTVTSSLLNGNRSTGEGGGAIFSSGDTTTISASSFVSNSATSANRGGGAIYADGGLLSIASSYFDSNATDGDGGAISLDNEGSKSIAVSDSLFVNNHADGGSGGGAIYLVSDGSSILGTTFVNNRTATNGGAINNWLGPLEVRNSTFSGNQADSWGGALYAGADPVQVNNVTIYSNTAQTAGGFYLDDPDATAQSTITNTIIAGNTDVDGSPDLTGTFSSGGNNLIGVSDGNSGFSAGVNGDLVGNNGTALDPGLAALANNSGRFAGIPGGVGAIIGTHEPLAGSSALGAGNNATCETTDQRGISRPQPLAGNCEIGAYEAYSFIDLALAKTDSPDPVSTGSLLTYTLVITNQGSANAQAITVTDDLPASLTSVSCVAPDGNCSVNGNSVTATWSSLSANQATTVTVLATTPLVAGVITNTATLTTSEDLTATNNSATVTTTVTLVGSCFTTADDGATIYGSADSTAVRAAIAQAVKETRDTVRIAGICAGVVTADGSDQLALITQTLTLIGGYTTTNWSNSDPVTQPTILDALHSGRVISASQPITVENLIVQNGYLGEGVGSGILALSDLELVGSQIRYNVADDPANLGSGGGAFVGGSANVAGTLFFSNTATGNGGGLAATGAIIQATTFQANHSVSDGGGLYAGDLAMISESSFLSNTSGYYGGGARLGSSACGYLATVIDTIFQGNQSVRSGGGLYVCGSAVVADSSFESNLAGSDPFDPDSNDTGGGMWVTDDATLTGTSFVNNRSAGNTGGLRVNGAATLIGMRFLGNSAQGFGGGLSVDGESTVVGSTILDNQSESNGGGAYLLGAAWIDATDFLSNTSNAGWGGGLFSAGTLTVTTSTFANNLAVDGAGLNGESDTDVRNSVFVHNQASGVGGGLYVDKGSAQVINSLFARNSAGSDGAAIYVDSANMQTNLIHNTIASTSLITHSAVAVAGGTVAISNTIITSHTVAISRTAGSVNENANLFFNNGTNLVGTISSGGASVIGNPAFVDPASDDYYLTDASAAVNMAVEMGISDDFEGESRPQEAIPDIGYDESPYALPAIEISNANLNEGNSGVVTMTFPITLSFAKAVTVTVAYTISAGSATNGVDYTAPTTGTITFAPGTTSQTVQITIHGDLWVESDENLSVQLSAPRFAVLTTSQATGTIFNDDMANVAIGNPSVIEGNSGASNLVFTVTLSSPVAAEFGLDYATSDGSATTADHDYAAASDSIAFQPGETSKPITITVYGDTKIESDETLTVTVRGQVPSGVILPLFGVEGVGTIVNDDAPTPTPTATATRTSVPPTATPTSTATNTPLPPTATPTHTSTNTPVPPTVTPTATSTRTSIDTPTATPTTTEAPNLHLTVLSDPPAGTQVEEGKEITYFVTLSNTGGIASNLIISGFLPGDVTLITDSVTPPTSTVALGIAAAELNGALAGEKLQWAIPTLAHNESFQARFVVEVNQATIIQMQIQGGIVGDPPLHVTVQHQVAPTGSEEEEEPATLRKVYLPIVGR